MCRDRETESATQGPGRPRYPRGKVARSKESTQVELATADWQDIRTQRRAQSREAGEQVIFQTGNGRQASRPIWRERGRTAGYCLISRADREIEDIHERTRTEQIRPCLDGRVEGAQIDLGKGVAGSDHSRCRDHYQQILEQLHVLSSSDKFINGTYVPSYPRRVTELSIPARPGMPRSD